MKITFNLLTLLLIFSSCQTKDEGTATLYKNGEIYTVDKRNPWAKSIVVAGGNIIFIGSDEDAIAFTENIETTVVDLDGKFVMPGIHDTHIHFEGFYNAKQLKGKTLRYDGTEKSIEELQLKLADYASKNSDLELLFVEQLPLALFPNLNPNKSFIDEVVSDKPVVVLSDSEHESLLNTRALELEGIDKDTPNPKGGEIIKDTGGKPTGLLKEKAAGLWGWKHFPALTREEHYQGMSETVNFLNSFGITAAKEQHAKNIWAQAFKDIDERDTLSMRIGLSWTYKGPLEPSPLEEQEEAILNRSKFSTEFIGVDYVKLSLDGTLGTTGSVVEPYLVTKDNGLLFYSLEELVEDVERFDSMGLGITVHANADGAVRQFLDALERVKLKNGKLNARHQIAHAVTIQPDDLARFNELNVLAEFSPFFWFPSDYSVALADQLGATRLAHIFPTKSLQEASGRFVLASDGPLFWQGPFPAIESAVTRKHPDNSSNEQLSPLEKIDLATAIEAYTINGAYLMNQESITGSLEKGKSADFVVLDQNLFSIEAEKISETKVLITIFNGEQVYERK